MRLISKRALEMLQEAKGETPNAHWIDHSICVGNAAGKIADALKLDADYAKTLGYIHDIGKKLDHTNDGVFPHAMKGYQYIKSLICVI